MTNKEDIESLNNLIKSYLDVLESVEKEPIFSVRGFFIFYLKAVWWEINLLVLPFILLIDLIFLLVNLFRQNKLNYFKSISARYLLDIYNSLKKGEIPALKFVTAKFLTKLLIHSHIKSKLLQIRKGLSLKELEFSLENNEAKKINSIKKQKALLKYFDNILPTGIQLKIFFSSLTTIAGAIAAIYTFIEENLDSKKKWSLDLTSLTTFFKGVIIFWIFSLIASILSLAVSCFVRKREILLRHKIFEKEHVVSAELRRQLKNEFPYDLMGWIIIFTVSMNANYFLYKNVNDKASFVLASMFLALPFIYAGVRRWKLNSM